MPAAIPLFKHQHSLTGSGKSITNVSVKPQSILPPTESIPEQSSPKNGVIQPFLLAMPTKTYSTWFVEKES